MTNKTAIITGGTGGLGKETALAFRAAGYNVAVNFLTSVRDAEKTAVLPGSPVMVVKADVGNPGDMREMADKVFLLWQKVDVLVNNAGIAGDALLPRQETKDWERIMTVNLKGAFNALRAFVPLMKGGGHVINISSYSGLKGKAGQAAYSASKAALLGLTKSAAIELAGEGIRVNALLPGYMPTNMGVRAAKAMARAREESLLKTLSDPAEVARFILYLSGTKNITGQVFCLDSRIV